MMSLIILKCFPDSLPLEVAYQTWVPFAFARSPAAHSNATTAERTKCVLEDYKRIMPTESGFCTIINQCHRILVVTQVLTSASGLPAIDWKRRFADAFLHFVGFECCNREREGQSYLGCDLNVRKDGSWLEKMVGPKVIQSGSTQEAGKNRLRDPLLMLEPGATKNQNEAMMRKRFQKIWLCLKRKR
ncbi:hypothetical protein P171DRAFT_278233 [Karstenula rhodostoma CBS 690.94]|uniref:Uncharacterized protein n=1 Tax=Karstenula rhodostoma CBS 690.94 TaxID=1392251 RepID=A0A9P4PMT4_9PLEO|nr:hypothetical protein P171DRAFT_278233 [Karstenula rhodostoma CBS 690.94]